MATYILNKRSFFAIFGITILCMVAFNAVHQPQQQYPPSFVILTSDERLISLRVNDLTLDVSEKVLHAVRNKRLLCSPDFRIQPGEITIQKRGTVSEERPRVIYIITPTYKRPEQIPDLTRLSQTLMNVPSIFWLIIEDAVVLNPNVAEIAERSGIPFIHLIAPMPKEEQNKKTKARGVSNRNRGLQWIRENDVDPDGVVYFADDDNTYDLRVFEEIRTVNTVGMFPVGLITSTGVSTPIVKDGIVTSFYDGWIANRKFPVDMAGFAFSVELLLRKPLAKMPFIPGYEEDRFLQSLEVKMQDIEPKASNCTKIFVWHTQTKKNKPPVKSNGTYENTNIDILYKFLDS